MLINKKMFITKPKKCYLLLDFAVESYPHYPHGSDILYNGAIKIFSTLKDLNDTLAVPILSSIKSTDDKLFKGYLYPAKEFLLSQNKNINTIFLIEKVENGLCFLEEIEKLEDISTSIENELSCEKTDSNILINNYLIFIGKSLNISYCCLDFEE